MDRPRRPIYVFNSLSDTVQVLDDPNVIGTTTFNEINDNSSIVGFYVGGDDFTHGLQYAKNVMVEGQVQRPIT